MFEHVHGDWLDQRKYPWISLTDAAVYLISPDDEARAAAVAAHDWARPFNRLLEWIQGGKLKVYEAWETPFKQIPKEDFLGVPIKYPSYPDDEQVNIRRAYQPGGITHIECSLSLPRPHNLSPKPAFDRYYQKGRSEPRWRDLKIRSEELVSVLEAANAEATQTIQVRFPASSDDARQEKRVQPKRERASEAISALWPNGIPEPSKLPNGSLCTLVIEWLKDDCKNRNIPFVPISDDSILRAAGRTRS